MYTISKSVVRFEGLGAFCEIRTQHTPRLCSPHNKGVGNGHEGVQVTHQYGNYGSCEAKSSATVTIALVSGLCISGPLISTPLSIATSR